MNHRLFFGILFGFLFFYLFVLQLIAIWPFTIDDMYISLRYAAHWTNGDGLLWNIGDPPVEGYSNFLFVMIAALALHVGFNPIVVLKIMGVIGLGFTAIGIYFLSRFWLSPILSLIPVVWLLIYRDEILWVSSGLETTIYQALIIGSLVSLLRGLGYRFMPYSRGSSVLLFWILAGVGLALAGLTRPEGGMIAAVLGVIALIQVTTSNQSARYDHWLLGLGIFLLIYVPYFIWRWHYFGMLFPNPVYCKGLMDTYWWILDLNFLKMVWPFILIGLFAQWRTRDQRLLFLWIPSVVYLILLMKADPISAFSQRLFLPALVLLFPLSMVGFQSELAKHFNINTQIWMLWGIAIWMALLFIPMNNLQQYRFFTECPQAGEQLRARVIHWLKPRVTVKDRIVLADSGMIPFHISAQFDDSYCLNNQWMAKQPPNEMFTRYCQHVFEEKPAVIILTSLQEKDKRFYTPADQCLKRELMRQSDYQREAIFQTGHQNAIYRYEIYSHAAHSH